MDISLFKRLTEAHPRAIVRLRSQYRMSADVMELSNQLIYAGQLRCGTEAVASARLHLPFPNRLRCRPPSSPAWEAAEAWQAAAEASGMPGCRADWVTASLDPDRRVVFLDTDCVPARETHSSGVHGNVYNPIEAEMCGQLVGERIHPSRSRSTPRDPAQRLAIPLVPPA